MELAKRTDDQKASQEKYMQKIQDIKVRVPKEHFEIIKEYAEKKGISINKLIISLLEKEMGIEFPSVREQNKKIKLEKET